MSLRPALPTLPAGVHVFERGWLSSNNILLMDDKRAVLIDSGYVTHAPQTLALVERALAGRPLDLLLNTHLHSDHCGGNAALQQRYPGLRTRIPPGDARAVHDWDENALSFRATGQLCERFVATGDLQPGELIEVGGRGWQVHAAPGHDPHSVILFEPDSRTLVSADALWERGFGVVFPELLGEPGFDDVGATLDLIETLAPAIIIPGHGPVFGDLHAALAQARRRLAHQRAEPASHAWHGLKVLLKFKLLERGAMPLPGLQAWLFDAPYVRHVHGLFFAERDEAQMTRELLADLIKARAALLDGEWVRNQ